MDQAITKILTARGPGGKMHLEYLPDPEKIIIDGKVYTRAEVRRWAAAIEAEGGFQPR